MTTISVLTHNKLEITTHCIDSIFRNTYGDFKVVVTDNNSTDGTLEFLRSVAQYFGNSHPITLIENKENMCFSKAHNNVMKMFPQDDIVLMNNDIEVPWNWLTRLHAFIKERNLGAASPAIIQYGGLNVGAVLDEHARGRSIVDKSLIDKTPPDWITGSCLYITRETVNKIGHLDEFFNFYYEDVDYCFRMKKAGINFACDREVQIIHRDSASSNPAQKKQMLEESRKYFASKWGYKI